MFIRWLILLILCVWGFSYCTPPFRVVGVTSELSSETSENTDSYEEDETDEDSSEEIDETKTPYRIIMDTVGYMTCDAPWSKQPQGAFRLKFGAYRTGGIGLSGKSFAERGEEGIKEFPYYRATPAIVVVEGRWATDSYIKDSVKVFPRIQLEDYLDLFVERKETLTKTFRDRELSVGLTEGRIEKYNFLAGFLDNKERPQTYKNEDNDNTFHGMFHEISTRKKEHFSALSSIESRYPSYSKDRPKHWDCDSNRFHFQIRRHSEHRNSPDEPGCSNKTRYSNDPETEAYSTARKLLGEEWNINAEDRCISLKSSRNICYRISDPRSKNSENSEVFFSDAQNCNTSSVGRYCPHYFSICMNPSS